MTQDIIVQGQSLDYVGCYLPEQAFAHGSVAAYFLVDY